MQQKNTKRCGFAWRFVFIFVSQSSAISDGGINCNPFFPVACTSEKILLRRVSVRAQRVHAPGCKLDKMLAFYRNA